MARIVDSNGAEVILCDAGLWIDEDLFYDMRRAKEALCFPLKAGEEASVGVEDEIAKIMEALEGVKYINVIFSEFEADNEEHQIKGCVSYPAVIVTEHEASPEGMPAVIVNGNVYGAGEMSPIGELQVPPEILTRITNAGYAAQPLSEEEQKQYWDAAKPVTKHWHPEARLIIYQN
jgi:hypothetical protein